MSDLYEQDFYALTTQQSPLLRQGRATEADPDHIADEIQDMGRSRRHELRDRLAVLLLHLSKGSIRARCGAGPGARPSSNSVHALPSIWRKTQAFGQACPTPWRRATVMPGEL